MRHIPGRTERDDGFTLVELMMVVLIIAALVMIAVPRYVDSARRAAEATCQATRTTVELADYAYYLQNSAWAPTVNGLAGDWLTRIPKCPNGGTYAWIDAPTKDLPARSLGCSIHYFPIEALTPLGSSFGEISTNMISLLKAYYAKYHKWPRTSSPYKYTDLGLDPADWQDPANHIYYSPSGSRLNISPEKGWDITVTNSKGKTIVLTEKSRYNLIYNVSNGKWYYQSINMRNIVDITTMNVVPAKK